MGSVDILGFSPGFISMVITVLIKCYGKDLNIRIIKNIAIEGNIPYKISGPAYDTIMHTEWDAGHVYNRKNFLGVGNVLSKKTVFDFFYKNYSLDFKMYCNIIHPGADIAENIKIGFGNFLNYGVTIGPFSEIGNFVTFNRHVGIGHHTQISDFCVINPGVNIAGFCEIGEGSSIGMGSNIIDGIKIGKNVIIGAGSLVNKDIEDNVVAYGIPAKTIRVNDQIK